MAQRLNSHMDVNNMHEAMQSVYKEHHSTETALIYIQNYILNSIEQHKVVLLVLLDLSAAFDTIDHKLIINRFSCNNNNNNNNICLNVDWDYQDVS